MPATSRERLAVEGEHVVPVAPLATEAGDNDAGPPAAMRLFERASR